MAKFVPNRRVFNELKSDLNDRLFIIGSILSSKIMDEAQARIYKYPVPSKYRYTRGNWLRKNIGHVVKTGKGVVVIFSNVKYAAYLEKLVGRRWQTTYQETDLTLSVEKLKLPSGNRPYGHFIRGIIKGIKETKKRLKGDGIKWKT